MPSYSLWGKHWFCNSSVTLRCFFHKHYKTCSICRVHLRSRGTTAVTRNSQSNGNTQIRTCLPVKSTLNLYKHLTFHPSFYLLGEAAYSPLSLGRSSHVIQYVEFVTNILPLCLLLTNSCPVCKGADTLVLQLPKVPTKVDPSLPAARLQRL